MWDWKRRPGRLSWDRGQPQGPTRTQAESTHTRDRNGTMSWEEGETDGGHP